jgi:amino acid adenylation domain-containing protein
MPLEDVQDIYPVSPMQAGMLFHTLDAPDSGMYVLQIRVALKGVLEWEVLEAAWDDVVHRHDALRAAFVWEDLDEPLQVVKTRVQTPWRRLDGRRLVAEQGPDAVDRWLARDRRTGFDMKQAPLMRVTVIELGEERHRLVWTLHHVLADAWSVAIVLDELQAAYHARLAGKPFMPGAAPLYRDFIAWLKAGDVDAAQPVFRRFLEGFHERTRLDLARPTGAGGDSATRRLHQVRLSARTVAALADTARGSRVTQTALFTCAWATVLGAWTGTSDIVFGLVVSGRGHGLAGAERAVGLYMNTIPARVRLDAAPTLRGLVEAIHTASLELRPYENTPLGKIQAWSELPAGSPLFDTLLIIENHPTASAVASSQSLSFGDVDPMDQSNYPLAGFVIPGEPLRLLVMSDPSVVEPEIAERLLRQFAAALERLPSNLDTPPLALPVLPRSERAQLDALAHGPALQRSDHRAVHHLIAETASRRPDAVALVCGERSLTYGELEGRSAAWARRLSDLGVEAGDRVALLLERGCDVVVAMLATLRSGGAYVPLDPSYPAARIRQVLDDCQPRALITSRALVQHSMLGTASALFVDDREAPEPGTRSAADVAGHDPAYVMYTSGSTGRPKGVVISHGNLLYSTHARLAAYGEAPSSFLLLSSFAFDSSVAGIYWTLAGGGTLVISEPGLESDVDRLSRCVAEHAVSHTLCLPSLYEVVLELAPRDRLTGLRTVVVAGEACPPGLIERHRAVLPEASLYNEYGPTEACVWCTLGELSELAPGAAAPIGRPIPGAEVRLLTHDGRLAPLGAPGEIWIAGPGLAAGYLNQPEATGEAFAAPPATGRRMYRSGDLGRYLADGSIEFLGRIDQQVKIRGHRIETAEVEQVLRQHPAVREAVVAAVQPGTSAARLALAAFVTASTPADPPAPEALRDHLRARLPGFMTPSSVAVVDELPRLPNGKVDREALARSAVDSATARDSREAPRDDFERSLVEVWRQVLGADVGIHDDFFALGGDSISSIRIVGLAQQRGVALTPSEIFDFPTIAELSAHRAPTGATHPPSGSRVMPATARVPGQGAPLFMVHGGRRMLHQMTERLREDRAVHLLVDHRDAGDVAPFASIGSLADEYLAAVRSIQSAPPRFLGGYSIGAPIAVEMARRLQRQGHQPTLVFLLDPPDDPTRFASAAGFVAAPCRDPDRSAVADGGGGPGLASTLRRKLEEYVSFAVGAACRSVGLETPLRARRRYVPRVYDRALRRHVLTPYTGPMLIFHSSDAARDRHGRTLWEHLEADVAETLSFAAAHTEFVRDPEVVDEWTRCLAEHLASLDEATPPARG